jgi:lipopolysaccharide export system permease protein
MIYQRYLLRNNLVLLLAIFTILIFIIWFSKASSFVHYITENGIEISKFIQLFILILPWLMMIIIPVSNFIATSINLNRLIISNEITILKNSGLTKFQIAKPIILIAILSSIFCYLISFYIMPYSNRVLRESKQSINQNYANLAFKSQTFETFKDLTIYSKSQDQENNLYEIFLHDERSSEYNLTVTAKKGRIIVENNFAILEMEDGSIQKYNYNSKQTEILKFDTYLFNLNENSKINYNSKLKPNEYFFYELFFPSNELSEAEKIKLKIEIHERIIDPLLSIVLTLSSLAFTLNSQFQRKQNNLNIYKSIIIAILYLIINLLSYNLIKFSDYFQIIPYLNFTIFTSFLIYNILKNAI